MNPVSQAYASTSPFACKVTKSSCWTSRGRIAYDIAGEGPCVVLLHPIGIDRSWWDSFATAWSPVRTLIAIDMLGHGESELLTSSITLAEHAHCVWEVLDAQGIGAASFLGVSMGGMVAQHVAIQRPQAVRALIACATAATFPDDARTTIRARGNTGVAGKVADMAPETLRRWFSDHAPAQLVARCETALLQQDWYSWSVNWQAISAVETIQGLSAINVPTLAVACAADASLPIAVTRRIAEVARGEFIWIEGASHFGIFETPARFIDPIDAFLRRHERQADRSSANGS
ncbi:3-oxoadipate enol-lactonase 2 [Variovorax sp. PBL-H6]|uniref:alpha/beta fold hydrolase n=1 Tax=Variovorax sp. PBL-H6 TaxID=434009 RepID=UPI0013180610|nr:alpha/beta fold hydrolase [Variovorax sp. PBL-H6]VTU33059.1 3-oxoadipate enol-lactonase 2 [Variovorax sp. PBL-H6]